MIISCLSFQRGLLCTTTTTATTTITTTTATTTGTIIAGTVINTGNIAAVDGGNTGTGDKNSISDFLAFLQNEMELTLSNGTTAGSTVQPAHEYNRESVESLYVLLSTANSSTFSSLTLGMSATEQLSITVLYGTAIAIALMGNLAVILAFLVGKRWDSDLSVYLANLAVSDIILSVFCMPFTMSQAIKHHWPFSEALCPLVMFLQLCSVLSSVYTLVAVGVDRYVFVTKPLEARFNRKRGKNVVAGIWLVAVALASFQLAVVRCTYFTFNGQQYKDCQEGWSDDTHRTAYTVAVAVLTYFLPLLVLVFTYHRIGRILWQDNIPGANVLRPNAANICPLSNHNASTIKRVKGKQRVVKMLIVVVLIFALCWLPLHVFFLTLDFFPEAVNQWRSVWDGAIFTYTFLTIHFLAMSSSFVNPIVYSFMSQNFRGDLLSIWQRGSSFIERCLHERESPAKNPQQTYTASISPRPKRQSLDQYGSLRISRNILISGKQIENYADPSRLTVRL
ncbi:putative Tachykinin-like peptides receptor 99D [Hypsibius exemplaris]|uniref:Tachykinin-like peptides receptor 99D n=1 Tax=Hypsibius exemplaris TaxID=2072580 RepID=A0A9X6NKR2_HYPEX|nr:putative Tachykinin-like peptides receptor 99D [Hypsibius exemplaris]